MRRAAKEKIRVIFPLAAARPENGFVCSNPPVGTAATLEPSPQMGSFFQSTHLCSGSFRQLSPQAIGFVCSDLTPNSHPGVEAKTKTVISPSTAVSSTSHWAWPPCNYEIAADSLVQRYYNSNAGRFYTPDPAGNKAVDPKNPTSWNMYAYAGDDPVNFNDPRGLYELASGGSGDPWFGADDCTVNGLIDVPGPLCGYSGPAISPLGSYEEDQPCNFTPQTLLSYMGSTPAYTAQGAPSSKPLATLSYAQTIFADAVADNVDPRLLVAISFVESKWGGDSPALRTDNAFGLMYQGSLINFTQSGGWASGIALAGQTVAKLMANGETSVSSLYSGKNGSYCVGPGCSDKVQYLTSKLTALGGNPNAIWSPCYEGGDGFYYLKP